MIRASLLRPRKLLSPRSTTRAFSLVNPAHRSHQNRVFDPVRQPNDLHSLTLLSAADNRALITLWSATWCPSCQVVKPLVRRLVEEERVGEREGGVGFVEVQMDSVLIEDLPVKYRISSMPTLLAFSRQEAQFDTKVSRLDQLKDEAFLREWLVGEAQRGGRKGGGGGSMFGW